MTRFEETVAKIAASPVKRALLKHVPAQLFKRAGLADIPAAVGRGLGAAVRAPYTAAKHVGDFLVSPDASKSPLGSAAGALLSGSAVGAGAWGTGKLLDRFDQSSDRLEAERKQMGQLTGEQKFRAQALRGLKPLHASVFASMGQDPVLSKADPALISSTYQTMKRFGPTIAADPNAARSFLLQAAAMGKGPDYATLKTLADAEQSVSRAGVMGA